MPELTSLSFAHPEVPAVARGSLTLDGPRFEAAHSRLLARGLDAFLLSTCLRVEIIWAGGNDLVGDQLATIYGRAEMAGRGTVRTGEDAFAHVCRVAAGLDSPQVGEPEVLAQFREAMSVWRRQGGGNGLGKTLDSALGVARVVRRRLGDRPPGSLAGMAAAMIAPHQKVAVLGNGGMARSAVRSLGDADVTVFARHPPEVDGRHLDELSHHLGGFDAVISAVPGGEGVLTADNTGAMSGRTEPLLLIDLGMPPAFDPVDLAPAIRYVGVDDLASNGSESADVTVERALVDGVARAWSRLAAPNRAGELIATILETAEMAVNEEVERFGSRLPAQEERALQQLAHTVARRVLHSPISYLGSTQDEETVEVLAKAFGVADD